MSNCQVREGPWGASGVPWEQADGQEGLQLVAGCTSAQACLAQMEYQVTGRMQNAAAHCCTNEPKTAE